MDHSYLLCDEVWLSTPTSTRHHLHYNNNNNNNNDDDIQPETQIERTHVSEHDCEVEFSIFFKKEESYLPKKGFLEYLQSQNLIFSRLKAIQWLIKTCSRFNLSLEALFNAANYLDRFISINHCHEWKNWMMELLSVACLTVASKFSETYFPSLHEIQMEGLDHTFEPITIQQMELILLNRLDWKLTSTTTYSCLELLIMTMKIHDFFIFSSLHKDLLIDRVTQLLLQTMLDYKMVEYRPSIAAVSAMWCGVEELIPSQSQAYLTHITGLFNHIHKDEIVKCRNIMLETKVVDLQYNYCRENSDKCPSSPVTVLLKDGIGVEEFHADLSIFMVQESDSNHQANKRRRIDDEQCS